MKIVGKLIEISEAKVINEEVFKNELLIVNKKEKKALLTLFNSVPTSVKLEDLEIGKIYIFDIIISARKLKNGQYINNLNLKDIKLLK